MRDDATRQVVGADPGPNPVPDVPAGLDAELAEMEAELRRLQVMLDGAGPNPRGR